MQYCWTTIHVSDMKQSLSFYQEIIGLKINRRAKPEAGTELVFLGSGETQIELVCQAKHKAADFGDNISLGFIVESISRITEFLDLNGIPILAGPFQPNPTVRFIYIKDPDGLRIQLVEQIAQ